MAKATTIKFNSHDGIPLDGKLWNSKQATEINLLVICVHPWTILGGSAPYMEHYGRNLVIARPDVAVVTFDLRGSGASGGSASIFCFSEVNDVLGACAFVKNQYNKPIVILSSSAGAAIGGTAAYQGRIDYNIIGYVGIGYTFGWVASIIFHSHFYYIKNFPGPKLFIQGSLDGFCSPSQLRSVTAEMKDAEVFIIDGVGHFELEHSAPLARVIVDQLLKFLAMVEAKK